jgi:flotillin
VLVAAEEALTKQGLVVDTLQIQEIRDGADYISNIGRPEAAKVRQEADVAETNAYQASQEAKIAAERVLLDRNRELKLRQAEIQAETDKATAQATAAEPLEQAIQQQAIVQQQQITAQKEVALRTERLNADVRAVAEAEAYRLEALAKAEATAAVSAADGRAQAVEREGLANRAARIAAAEAFEREGRAEAAALEAKGTAEAIAIDARARALETQSQAVLAQELIQLLPQIAAEYASAISSIDSMTVVSADGTSKVAADAMGSIKGMLEMTKETVGIDLVGMLNGAVVGGAAGAAAGRASSEPRVGYRRPESSDSTNQAAHGSDSALLPTESAESVEHAADALSRSASEVAGSVEALAGSVAAVTPERQSFNGAAGQQGATRATNNAGSPSAGVPDADHAAEPNA